MMSPTTLKCRIVMFAGSTKCGCTNHKCSNLHHSPSKWQAKQVSSDEGIVKYCTCFVIYYEYIHLLNLLTSKLKKNIAVTPDLITCTLNGLFNLFNSSVNDVYADKTGMWHTKW